MASLSSSSHPRVPVTRSVLAAAVFLAAVAVVAVVGGLASADAGAVYARLEQPAWAPPQWLFGPAWTVLYLLIAASGWLVWRSAGLYAARAFFVAYGVQLLLNAAWSPLFFGAGLYGAAFVDIVLLAVAIVVTMALAVRHSRTAALLLVPYLLWVGYAGALNLAIWLLN